MALPGRSRANAYKRAMGSAFDFIPSDYPDAPGVYLMKDARGRILYVGKAVSLRRRLASYFV